MDTIASNLKPESLKESYIKDNFFHKIVNSRTERRHVRRVPDRIYSVLKIDLYLTQVVSWSLAIDGYCTVQVLSRSSDFTR